MNAALSKDLNSEVGRTIHDFRVVGEGGRAADKSAEAHNSFDTLQISESRLRLGHDVQEAGLRAGNADLF